MEKDYNTYTKEALIKELEAANQEIGRLHTFNEYTHHSYKNAPIPVVKLTPEGTCLEANQFTSDFLMSRKNRSSATTSSNKPPESRPGSPIKTSET